MQAIPCQALGGRAPGYHLCQEQEEMTSKVKIGSKGGLRNKSSSSVNIPFSGVASARYLHLKNFFIA